VSKTTEDLHFSPFTVLLGIISGTVVAIAVSLCVVCLIFWILRNEEPRLMAEVGSLLLSTAIFLGLAGSASLSFYGSLKQLAWRHMPMTALWAGLLLAGLYYWPD
jgi:hypothetical protein